MKKKYLISCDWGTTAFRLRLINTVEDMVISEVMSQEGVAQTYSVWKSTNPTQTDKQCFFRDKLKKQIAVLAKQANKHLEGIDIALSGMVSSSIGMYEVPYATVPFNLDGSHSNVHIIEADESFPHKIILISGVRIDNDVMRGEETQLIGLTELLNLSSKTNFILIFPGTHSKHLYVQKNSLTGFHTYMTGEMFNIVSHHSILKDSIDLSGLHDFSHLEQSAFKKGVLDVESTSILNSLFKVRTNQLFHKLNKKENGFYLSGLLIGSELKHLVDESDCQLVLCSGNNLYEFYKWAIEVLDLSERTITVPSEMIDKAVVVGQMKIFSINTEAKVFS
jgi:2-dehydro-3-deoxygalactonokinase